MRRLLSIMVWLLAASGTLAAPNEQPLGEITFANSGSSTAQAPFQRGLALLHNFEYSRAASAFIEAQKADPDFAMAYWGEAMTYNHPIWFEQDAAAARAALAKLGASAEIRSAKAKTDRERGYLKAVETLYGPGSKNERDVLYSDAMGALHARFPDDVDATAFYALSILGTAHEGRDFATYMRAAALLEDVFPEHRHHPGVLHYMIHAYDDPIHAPLGMRAARLYGSLAAGAPHALHMTSHIFVALGLWDQVIAANEAAMKAESAPNVAKGLPPLSCGHYDEWLVYAYLQTRDYSNADRVAEACRTAALGALAKHPQPSFPKWSMVISYSDMVVRRAVETGQWPTELDLPLDDGAYVEARFNLGYGHALTQTKDSGGFRQSAGQLHELLARMQAHPAAPGSESQWAQALAFWRIMVEEIDALRPAVDGNVKSSMDALRASSITKPRSRSTLGPPDVPKPPLELLGDMLLEDGQPEAALQAYQKSLARTPGRTLAIRGVELSRAAIASIAASATPTGGQPSQTDKH